MSNSASEKMLQAVSIARESASRAEREYDRGADRIQMMASRNIDLFGGSAVSQVADIASESRKICDALYASYQMLIKMLDISDDLSHFRQEQDKFPGLSMLKALHHNKSLLLSK